MSLTEKYVAVLNTNTENQKYKAIFPAQAALLGFSDTGETVEIQVKADHSEMQTVPLWAELK